MLSGPSNECQCPGFAEMYYTVRQSLTTMPDRGTMFLLVTRISLRQEFTEAEYRHLKYSTAWAPAPHRILAQMYFGAPPLKYKQYRHPKWVPAPSQALCICDSQTVPNHKKQSVAVTQYSVPFATLAIWCELHCIQSKSPYTLFIHFPQNLFGSSYIIWIYGFLCRHTCIEIQINLWHISAWLGGLFRHSTKLHS